MQLDAALEDFLLHLHANGRSIHTRRQYRRHVLLLGRWLQESKKSCDVTTITPRVLAEFLVGSAARMCDGGSEEKRPTSANALRTSLRCFFGHLHDAGILPTNPAKLILRAVCSPSPPRSLSAQERQRLVEALSNAATVEERRDRGLFLVLLETGMRIGSALGLRVEEVDLEARLLRVTTAKAGRSYEHRLTEAGSAALTMAISGRRDGLVFPGIGVRHAQRRFRIWAARAGTRGGVCLHSLRHTFARAAYEHGRDLLDLQKNLGHRSILSTAVYAR